MEGCFFIIKCNWGEGYSQQIYSLGAYLLPKLYGFHSNGVLKASGNLSLWDRLQK